MDESNAIRAITIGVSTFIAVLTISAVMMYYGTARATVQTIGTGEDLSQNYADYIVDILLYNTKTDGIGVKNILNYFYLNDRVSVNIKKMTNMGSVKGSLTSIEVSKDLVNVNKDTKLYNKTISNIIATQKFNITVEYYDSGKTDIKTITIEEI